MKKHLRDFPRPGVRRFVLVLLLFAALPRIAPAASYFDLRVIDVKKGESVDNGQNFVVIVDFQWSAKRNETHSLQFSPDLVQPFFVIDSFTRPADGTVTYSYFLPPNTPKGFFRIGLPQVQINSVQPFTISNFGGTFFVTGQVFDPSYSVRIDGNPVTANFIDGSTFQVNVGPLAQGFHTITIVDGSNNVVATLSNGLFVNGTGRTDQESPPRAPDVNNSAIGSNGGLGTPFSAGGDHVGLGNLPPNNGAPLWPRPLDDPNDRDLGWHNLPGNAPSGPLISTGEADLWGYSPRFLPSTGPTLGAGHYYLVDGTPVVSDVLFTKSSKSRAPTDDDDHDSLADTDGNCPFSPDTDGDSCIDGIGDACECAPPLPVAGTGQFRGLGLPCQPRSLESGKGCPLFGIPSVNEATGELFVEYLDLVIPGRGLDLVWGRTYRSKIGLDTAMGVGWDFSYNIRAAQSGSNITVQDGQNRIDTYFLQPDGSFSTDELFRRGTLAGNVFTLQFADKTSWVFKPLDGSPTSGKIDKIIDRNSNQLQFQYDPPTGRLMLIIDTLGRPFQIGYDGAGRIQSVQDFAGRTFQYQHYVSGPGGSLGDLIAVTSPAVTGTPTGNNFPAGKTARFTYSAGFGDAPRNHNLLTIADGNNLTWFTAIYSPAAVATDLLYDRLASEIVGTAGETKVFTYLAQTPSPANRFATTKAIVNDAVGNVHESLFDGKNRLIDLRQFTGRSTPGSPVTESTNRPTGQLRPSDPAFFKTTIDWNRDSLPTRVTWPRGNGVEMVYERDFDPATNPRLRGNLRVHRQLPISGAALVDRFEDSSGFGTPEQGFRSGKWARTDYNFETPSTSLLTTRQNARNGAPYLRFHFETVFTTKIDWSGPGDEGPEESITFVYGTLRTDPRGFTWKRTRDANGNATSLTRPDGVTTTYEYNSNGQLTAVVWPPNSSAHSERDEWRYYSGGSQNGYLQSLVRDAGGLNLTTSYQYDAVGNLVQVTDARGTPTQFAVNQLNQVVQVTYESAAPSQTPAPYLRNVYYDANNRVTSVDVQNKNEFGTVGANAFFTTSFTYDSLDRRTSTTREVDSGHNITTQYFYDAARNLTEIRSPLAVSAVQPDARVQYAYDERNLPFTATAAPGSANATRSTYSYDANGNLNKIDRGAPAGTQHTTTAIYDGFDRLSSTTSPANTQLSLTYNANHQPTQRTVVGTFLDAAGNPTTGTLASSSSIYDSSGYCTGRIDSFFDIVIQVPILDGARTTTYSYDSARNRTLVTDDNGHTTQYSYDGANRLSRVTDPKGNRTDYTYDENGNLVAGRRTDKSDTAAPDQAFTRTYVYDGLDRLITSTDNVGNARSYMYDSRSNRVRFVDPRNNLTQYEYDGLNRLTRSGRDMNANSSGFDAGTDVVIGRSWDDNSRLISQNDPNSHATQYQYDPLGRLTRRNNADATFETWSYDPWGNALQSNDENGTLCINNYDNLNRLKQRQITPGGGVSSATTFEIYDYPGDYYWPDRAINNAGAVRYTYDSLGRVLSEKLNNRTTTYTYDGVGNMRTLQSPGGRTITYAYDTSNLCTSLSLSATGDGDSLGSIATCKYIGGRLESVSHRNGTSTSYTYDGFVGAPASSDLGWGRLAASVTRGTGSTVIDQRTFTYDAAQNLKERYDARASGPQLLHHYDYDAANRHVHTQMTAGGPVLRDTIYTYDLNGNRVTVNGLGTPNPGAYTQNPATPAPADAQMNQYTTSPLGNYVYDANGNRTNLNGGGGNTGYKYDFANRLVDLTNLNTGLRIANYQYDALGRRIQKTLDPDGTPSVLNFFYSGRHVLEERDGAGAVTAAYSLERSGESCDDDCSPNVASLDRITSWEHQYEFSISRLMEEEGIYYSFAPAGRRGPSITVTCVRGNPTGLTAPTNPGTLTINAVPAEMRRGGSNYTYHAEVVPWLWLVTNSSGSAAERYDYEDFGDPHIFDGSSTPLPSSAIGNPYLFKGMRFDAESGLYCSVPTLLDRDAEGLFDTMCTGMFDPKIGASLQRESSHAVNGWRSDSPIFYYVDPWAWTGTDGWVPIPIDP